MTPIAAIAVFGVPEREVDALIEDITCAVAAAARWLVFGTDDSVLDTALFLLEHEGLERESVVWLHGTAVLPEPPTGFRAAFRVS